jgi:hypothetical protein
VYLVPKVETVSFTLDAELYNVPLMTWREFANQYPESGVTCSNGDVYLNGMHIAY